MYYQPPSEGLQGNLKYNSYLKIEGKMVSDFWY